MDVLRIHVSCASGHEPFTALLVEWRVPHTVHAVGQFLNAAPRSTVDVTVSATVWDPFGRALMAFVNAAPGRVAILNLGNDTVRVMCGGAGIDLERSLPSAKGITLLDAAGMH